MGIQWIFFDLGSTLIDETESERLRIEDMVAGSGITYETLYNALVDSFRENNRNGYAETLERFRLKKAPWRPEDERLYPESRTCLERLHRRYKLGIVANQIPGTEDRLRGYGILQYFDFVVASAEAGVAKPDPRIFHMALERARCLPEQAVMVGDRLDCDIAPAKALGMKTIWIKQGFWRYASPCRPEETPDHIISDLTELYDLLD